MFKKVVLGALIIVGSNIQLFLPLKVKKNKGTYYEYR